MGEWLDLILVAIVVVLVVPVLLARAWRRVWSWLAPGVNRLAWLADAARQQADEIMSRPPAPPPAPAAPVPPPVPPASPLVPADTAAVSAGSGAGTGSGAPVPAVPDDVLLVLLAMQRSGDGYRFTANSLAGLFGGNREARLATIRAARGAATYLDNLTPAQLAVRAALDAER